MHYEYMTKICILLFSKTRRKDRENASEESKLYLQVSHKFININFLIKIICEFKSQADLKTVSN